MVQVAPGIQVALRSSQETWEAIGRDFYMPGLCQGCQATVFCIQDAAYVLCPDPGCRAVSPMDGQFVDRVSAGVGLGFRYDDLVRWQREIIEEAIADGSQEQDHTGGNAYDDSTGYEYQYQYDDEDNDDHEEQNDRGRKPLDGMVRWHREILREVSRDVAEDPGRDRTALTARTA
jgi:hypothetical protein